MRRALYILGELKDEDIVWLASVGKRISVEEEQCIIRAGQALDTLYLIIEGRMAVSMEGGARIAELGAGDIVGEMSMIEKRPPAVAVTALTRCALLAVAHDVLQRELNNNLGLAARFYRAIAVFLSDRLRGTVSQLGYGFRAELEPDAMPIERLDVDNELDEVVLDRVHLAGDRLRRLVDLVEP